MFFKKKAKAAEAGNPRHIGIIMDGNGRWAQRRGMPRSAGHNAGAGTLREIVRVCGDIGIEALTVYAFSTENIRRSKSEVDELMRLMKQFLTNVEQEIGGKNIRLRIIGERDMLSLDLLKQIEYAEDFTKHNTQLILNIAIFYGGQAEIASVANKLIAEGKPVTPESISENVYTAGQPPLDLIIRTGGEVRLSNFLLWQSAYAELYFCDTLFPDFGKRHLLEAIADYKKRKRNFGSV